MKFSEKLLIWFKKNQRNLPWRNTHDPYKIWLSEIILQQTRIGQGIVYYNKFLEKFPDIYQLARASEDQVLATWQGLGYYSRARNLHHTAKNIVDNYQGEFPTTYHELLKLKGVGKYTAAAIASIAFNKAVAVVDGNVLRLICRYFGIDKPIDRLSVSKHIESIANELIDPDHPSAFNQAMMDMGATVCKPKTPSCQICPFLGECFAQKNGLQSRIPFKEKKVKVKKRFFHFFFIYHQTENKLVICVEKRTGNDIWKNLYQFPLIETPDNDLPSGNVYLKALSDSGEKICMEGFSLTFKHILTHQLIEAFFHKIPVNNTGFAMPPGVQWVDYDTFEHMGKPVLINRFLKVWQKSSVG
ncbi:MAG: A/G-specific adenine glycosylase [Bacteroidota bacterium]